MRSTAAPTTEPTTDALHAAESRLLARIRALGHGELLIKVADGLPVSIERGVVREKLV
jgi:hypothetical protein